MIESAALARRLGRAPAHPPRRDDGRGRVLPGAVRVLPGRVHGEPRVARRRRLVRARGAPRRQRRATRWARPEPVWRTARRPTPGSARASHGPATCATPASRSGSASTARRRNEASSPARGAPARRAVRPRPRRPAGAHRAGRARDGDSRRRRACSVATTRSARSSRASSPTSRCGGSTRWPTPTSTTPSPPSSWARRRRWSCCWSTAGVVVEKGRLRTVDEDALALETAAAHRDLVARAR